jgi:predicted RNase H-like HicB family nuclease
MLSVYPACFFKEDNGYSVIFPDLNNLATCGGDIEDSMSMAIDCLAGYIYTSQKDGENIPKPSKITDIDIAVVSEQTFPGEPVGEAFVNMVSVDVASYAKEHFEKSVRKTLTIPAWLNYAALSKGINFSQVLQEALLEKISSKNT